MTQTFLTIPSELRCKIYEFVFLGKRLDWMYRARWYCEVYRHNCLAIRFVSKQCYEEACLPFYQVVEVQVDGLLGRLDSEPEYHSSANVVLRLIRKMVVTDHYISRAGAGRLVDVLPNLESLVLWCGDYYTIPDVEEKSLNLKTSIERSISDSPWRLLYGDCYDGRSGSISPGFSSLIRAWRARKQSFRMTSYADVRLNDFNMSSIVVGRFDFASRKMKIVRQNDSEVITEFVLYKLVH